MEVTVETHERYRSPGVGYYMYFSPACHVTSNSTRYSLGIRLIALHLHYPKLSNRPTVDPFVNASFIASWTIPVVSE